MSKINRTVVTISALTLLLAAWVARAAGELGQPSAIELTMKGEDDAKITTTAVLTVECAKVILVSDHKLLLKLVVHYQNTSPNSVHIDYPYAALKDANGRIYPCGASNPYQSRAPDPWHWTARRASCESGEAAWRPTFVNEIEIPFEKLPDAWGEKNENKYFIGCPPGETFTNSAVFEVQTSSFSGDVYFGFISPFNRRLIEGQFLIFDRARSTYKFRVSKFAQDGSAFSYWKDVFGKRTGSMSGENRKTFYSPVWSEAEPRR